MIENILIVSQNPNQLIIRFEEEIPQEIKQAIEALGADPEPNLNTNELIINSEALILRGTMVAAQSLLLDNENNPFFFPESGGVRPVARRFAALQLSGGRFGMNLEVIIFILALLSENLEIKEAALLELSLKDIHPHHPFMSCLKPHIEKLLTHDNLEIREAAQEALDNITTDRI